MPHKFNAARRHKFDKAQYRVINWAEYNESLRQRGDLTIWVSDEAQSVWSAPRRTSRGGQRRYSDLAIETCLTLRTAYRLGLRQTQGLMGSRSMLRAASNRGVNSAKNLSYSIGHPFPKPFGSSRTAS